MESVRTSKTQDNVRMAGFLEKKGKMKLMSPWKKYWFVLEERLLLYYRSEVEYTNLSPCRGSLNMGLVTTVCPGSSSGPCIIHVVTRTQVVQLRARNRATQEEWLQALLHSMALPLVPKITKLPAPKKNLLKYGSSLDNIPFEGRLKHTNFENEWTLPRKLDLRKKLISGTFYGGSLDTAIWSEKFKPVRTPSPNTPKGKLLERFLGFAKDSESMNLVAVCQKNSRLSLNNDNEMKYVGKTPEIEEESEREEDEVKCKVHDENRNHDLYSFVNKRGKKLNKTLSDTELNKTGAFLDSEKTHKKDESPFERIKHALSKIPKNKILKTKPEGEKTGRSSKKRRQSFLQKVFRKTEYDSHDYDSDINDPLYDTLEHAQEQHTSLIPVIFREEGNALADTEKVKEGKDDELTEDPQYSEVHKPIAGSKTILPAQTMSELRVKLKSRESLENQELRGVEDQAVENDLKKDKSAPTLPPRRVSRPISPWHDVPTNNAPVNGSKPPFFMHQAIVKFNDPIQIRGSTSLRSIDVSTTDEYSDDLEDEMRLEVVESFQKESFNDGAETQTWGVEKNDDLSILLEQLTKITVAPLAEPEFVDDSFNYSSDSEKFWSKSQLSDPDYDIPRPHKSLSILISQGNEIISPTEFMGRRDNNSDTSSSFRSMEPDSLEMAEKKGVAT